MTRGPTFLMVSLVFIVSFVCCCCGGLGGSFSNEQIQELMAGNLDNLMGEAAPVDIEEIIATPTPMDEADNAGEETAGEMPAEAEAETPVEATLETPAGEGGEGESAESVPVIPGLEGSDEEAAQAMLDAIEQQLEQGGDEALTFGCDDPNIPMPGDAEACVSIAGFTTYSTAMGETEINRLYDDYFTGQGWESFPEAMQEDVLNAWQKEGVQGYAFLSFTAGGGENGKNMVNLAVITE